MKNTVRLSLCRSIFKSLIFLAIMHFLSACSIEMSITKKNKTAQSSSGALTLSLSSSYVGPSNQASYAVSGTCTNSEGKSIDVIINSAVVTTATCSGGNWSVNLNVSSSSEAHHTIQAQLTAQGTSSATAGLDIIKDLTAPNVSAVTVNDGTYSGSATQTTNITWGAATDALSGLARYEVAIGTSAGGSETVTWTNVSTATSTQLSGSFVSGTTYYASVRAVDNAGNTSSIAQGDGWMTDSVVPVAPGTLAMDTRMTFTTTTSPALTWTAGSDTSSGVQGYQLAVGTSAGGTETMNWTSIGNILTTTLNSLTLSGSTKYYSSVKTLDNAGNASTTTQGSSWYNFSQTKLAVDNSPTDARLASNNAQFGSAVAVSEDGLTMIVGAPYDDTDATGGSYVSSAGAVFVYIKSGGVWTLEQKLVATGTNARITADWFGRSVSISGDTIVVGATQQDYDASGATYASAAGAVYVFTRTVGVWSQQQKLVATGTNARNTSDYFGYSVSVSGDTVVVGAYWQDYDDSGANLLSNSGAAYVFTRTVGVWSQQQKLVVTGTNARIASDYFGDSVSISGDTVVVGANGQDYDASGAALATSAGAAYVFTRTAGVWSQQQKLVATGTNARIASDSFGDSVSISGDTVVVGANGQDYNASGAALATSAGAAYVFTRTAGVWSQQQKLVATGTNARVSSDNFGNSIAISGDTVVVGAYAQDYDASGANLLSDSGAAYVFTRTAGVWSQLQKLVATGTNARIASDEFGGSVSISGDTIVASAPRQDYDASGANLVTDAGVVYTYSVAASYAQTQKVVNTVAVQNRITLASDNFGYSVAISEDGATMVVSAPYNYFDENNLNYMANAGAAYVYVKQSGSWVFQQKLVATGTNARVIDDQFGYSVSISGDTVVVGARYQDYDASGANLISDAGAAYVYTRTAGVWIQQQKLVATGTNARVASDWFGYVSISGDTIVASAPRQYYDASGANLVTDAGAAYVYTRTAGVWTQQQKLVATGTNARIASDEFGYSVSISGDTVVVGARYQDYDASGANLVGGAGAAFVYTRSAGVWTQQQKLVATGTNTRVAGAGESFGYSVSISGDTVVVGVPNQSYDASGANLVGGAGAAFVFTRTAGVWSQQQRLVATGTNARMSSDGFGSSVSISGDTVVVGAYLQDYDESGVNLITGAGAAYVFTRTSGVWTQQLKLTPIGTNARVATDYFGTSVSVYENAVSGSWTIGIGSKGQGYDSSGTTPSSVSGAAFIYH